MDLYKLIVLIASGSTIIPIVAGLINYKRLDKERLWLMGLLFIALIVQTYSYWLFTRQQNNLFLLHFYTPLEFLILVKIFSLWFDSKKISKSLLGLAGLFLVFVSGKNSCGYCPVAWDAFLGWNRDWAAGISQRKQLYFAVGDAAIYAADFTYWRILNAAKKICLSNILGSLFPC